MAKPVIAELNNEQEVSTPRGAREPTHIRKVCCIPHLASIAGHLRHGVAVHCQCTTCILDYAAGCVQRRGVDVIGRHETCSTHSPALDCIRQVFLFGCRAACVKLAYLLNQPQFALGGWLLRHVFS